MPPKAKVGVDKIRRQLKIRKNAPEKKQSSFGELVFNRWLEHLKTNDKKSYGILIGSIGEKNTSELICMYDAANKQELAKYQTLLSKKNDTIRDLEERCKNVEEFLHQRQGTSKTCYNAGRKGGIGTRELAGSDMGNADMVNTKKKKKVVSTKNPMFDDTEETYLHVLTNSIVISKINELRKTKKK